jgi:catechol 2,3-dioxygenase-like lactoylglutathione lyase family enzyme
MMLDHVSIGVSDLERSRRFYDAVLRPLGIVRTLDFAHRGSDYGAMAGQLGVEFTITLEAGGVLPARGMHICFRAPDREAVRAFHVAALAVGGSDAALPDRARYTIATTTRHSSSTLMDIASRRSATRQWRRT